MPSPALISYANPFWGYAFASARVDDCLASGCKAICLKRRTSTSLIDAIAREVNKSRDNVGRSTVQETTLWLPKVGSLDYLMWTMTTSQSSSMYRENPMVMLWTSTFLRPMVNLLTEPKVRTSHYRPFHQVTNLEQYVRENLKNSDLLAMMVLQKSGPASCNTSSIRPHPSRIPSPISYGPH